MSSDASKPRIVPAPILVAGAFAFGGLVHRFFPVPFLPDLGYMRPVLAVLLCVVSLAIGLSGVREFHRHDTPTNPYRPTSALVTSGIFRHTRNPMYLGFVLLACGVAVGVNSIGFLIAAVLLATLLDVLVISQEERSMSESFGEEFQSYCHRTRRWL